MSSKDLHQRSKRVVLSPTLKDRVQELGFFGVRCRTDLYLDRGGGLPPLSHGFVVDSGANVSIISLELAQLTKKLAFTHGWI